MLPFLGKLEKIVSFFLQLELIPFGFTEYNKSTLNVQFTESAQPESNH